MYISNITQTNATNSCSSCVSLSLSLCIFILYLDLRYADNYAKIKKHDDDDDDDDSCTQTKEFF